MIIRCRANIGRDLSKRHFELGYSPASVFHLVLEKSYRVFGISLWQDTLSVLIVDENGSPNWHPIELFHPMHGQFDSSWYFSTDTANEHGVTAIWGYEQLINQMGHYQALLERDADAERMFRSVVAAASSDVDDYES